MPARAELRTPRLSLLPAGPADFEAAHRLWSDPVVRRYLFDGRQADAEETRGLLEQSAQTLHERGFGIWLWFLRETDAEVEACAQGFAGLLATEQGDPALVYGSHPSCSGRGLATEAAHAVLEYARGPLALARVVADVDEPNHASRRVLEKLGMRQVRRSDPGGRPLLYFETHEEA